MLVRVVVRVLGQGPQPDKTSKSWKDLALMRMMVMVMVTGVSGRLREPSG